VGGGGGALDTGSRPRHVERVFLAAHVSQVQKTPDSVTQRINSFYRDNTCKMDVVRSHRRDIDINDNETGNRIVSAMKFLHLTDEQGLHFYT
jgi:hypothetical protein